MYVVVAEFGDLLLAQSVVPLVMKTVAHHPGSEPVAKFACGLLQNLSAHGVSASAVVSVCAMLMRSGQSIAGRRWCAMG
jgi:hypothetical protein